MRLASDIVCSVRISDIYRALTGKESHRIGADTARGPATWRGGDGFSVSMDNSRGVWHDFVTDEGGGVLDLVQRARGGTRQEALRWVADFAGTPLSDDAFSPAERAQWAKERRELEQDLPDARYWQRGAVNMAEDLLTIMKAALFDPTPDPEDLSEPVPLQGSGIYDLEQMLSRLRPLDGSPLVNEYRWWLEHYPGMTAAMVRAAKQRERAERRVLLAYLRRADPERHAA